MKDVPHVKAMELPFLFVVGNKGVGKSYLLSKLFETSVEHNSSSKHVTMRQLVKEKATEHFGGFVDTVGLDTKQGNFPTICKELRGKFVVFVFLNNDIRIDSSLDPILSKLGLEKSQIWVANCHNFTDKSLGKKGVMNIKGLKKAFNNGSLVSKKVFINAPPEPRAPKQNQQGAADSIDAPRSKAEKSKQTYSSYKYMKHSLFKNLTIHFDDHFSYDNRFKDLTDEIVAINRGSGDKILGLILERIVASNDFENFDGVDMNNISDNQFLEKFYYKKLGEQKGKEILQQVYPAATTPEALTPEKVGDLVEAMIHITFSARLLEDIIEFYYDTKAPA